MKVNKLKNIPIFIPIIGFIVVIICQFNFVKDKSYAKLTEDSSKPAYWVTLFLQSISWMIFIPYLFDFFRKL